MTLNELIDRLNEIKNNGYGELIVAISDEDLKEVEHCQLSLSSDGVGKFVELS